MPFVSPPGPLIRYRNSFFLIVKSLPSFTAFQTKSMATQLNEIQISLIWAEAIINGFVNGPNPQPPLAFLKESTQFIPFFDKAQQQAVPLDGQLKLLFHPPWRKPTGQRFWQAYLENEPPATVNGKRAWRSLVPLRAELPFKITAPSTG